MKTTHSHSMPQRSPQSRFRSKTALGFVCGLIAGVCLSAASWIPQGPAPIINAGNVDGMVDPTNPQDGAVHVIAPHPTDPNTIYIGTANGGIWKTVNGGTTWTPLTDSQLSLSIGGIAFDTEDKTYKTLVVGIGRWSNSGEDGGPRTGMLITTDAGATWSQIGTNVLTGFNLGAVVARGSVIMATANKGDNGNGGFFRSTDKGVSFSAGPTGLPANGRFTALVGDPTDPKTFYTADLASGLYKSTDSGANWTSINGSITNFAGAPVNVVIAVGANGGSVFASIVNAGGKAIDMYNSRNQGTSWVAMDPPAIREKDALVSPNASGQGNNSSVAADPTNPNLVYIAGDTQPFVGVSSGARAYSGRMFRGDMSLASGSQWVYLTGNFTTNSSAPHADTRYMIFDSAGNLLEGDDGGIYKRTSAATTNGGWFSINGNLVVTEMHSVAYDRLTKTLLSGNQDNGSSAQGVAGGLVWTEVAGGDGGKVAINNNTFTNFSVRYFSSQNLGGFAHSKIDTNNASVDIAYPTLMVGGTNLAAYAVAKGDEFMDEEENDSGDAVAFYPPVVLNRIDQSRIVIGNRSLYAGKDDLSGAMTDTILLTDLNGGTNNFDSTVGAIFWGHKDNPNLMLVGAGDALFVSTTSQPGSFVALTNYTGGTINDVMVHGGTMTTYYVASGSTVWSSTDSGVTWSNIGTGLVGLGTQQIRTLQFISRNGSSAILAGGLGGFYALKQEANATWFKVGTGMPNSIVWDSRYDEADDVLVAGTLGRGAWTLPSASSSVFVVAGAPVITVQPKPQAVIAGTTATFTVTVQSDSAVTYQWRKDGKDIPNGTSATLSLPSVSNADEANYSVLVSNATASVTSEIVKLTVNPAGGAEIPVLQIQILSGNRFKVTWQNGGRLQQTTRIGGLWTEVAGPAGTLIETNNFLENNFYRVVNP